MTVTPGFPLFRPSPGVELFLASTSPRRRQLLADLCPDFTALDPVCLEPKPDKAADGKAHALMTAQIKCEAALNSLPSANFKKQVVVAADTVVCIDGQILGKPENSLTALCMLRKLNGRAHQVHTAVCIAFRQGGDAIFEIFAETSAVVFARWPETVLLAYADSGEPLDKAGAYAIQGRGAFLAERLEGSWSNVVGLPLAGLAQRLLEREVVCLIPDAERARKGAL